MNIYTQTRTFGEMCSEQMNLTLEVFGHSNSRHVWGRPNKLFRRRISEARWWKCYGLELLCCLRDWAACTHWFNYEFCIISKSAWGLCEAICPRVEIEAEMDPEKEEMEGYRMGLVKIQIWILLKYVFVWGWGFNTDDLVLSTHFKLFLGFNVVPHLDKHVWQMSKCKWDGSFMQEIPWTSCNWKNFAWKSNQKISAS